MEEALRLLHELLAQTKEAHWLYRERQIGAIIGMRMCIQALEKGEPRACPTCGYSPLTENGACDDCAKAHKERAEKHEATQP